jgi:hypothetical protein
MRNAWLTIATVLVLGGALAACAYTPVPGAESTLTASPEASAGGR